MTIIDEADDITDTMIMAINNVHIITSPCNNLTKQKRTPITNWKKIIKETTK